MAAGGASEANLGYRKELREAVAAFACGQATEKRVANDGGLPKHINLYLFGPQGSGKTSFIRSCFRAMHGPAHLDEKVKQLETSLQRSDDGTSQYSVYSLTDRICLHDTRGQREYTPAEMQQLRLVLEGRARPDTLIQQRRRYWLLLHEFWRSDEQMRRTFSKTVLLSRASLDTEPHFAFLTVDPNQQDLLLEDVDFRQCYGNLLGDFSDRGVPHALLCTHGDTLTASIRSALLKLPEKLNCRPPKAQGPPAGVQRPIPTSLSQPGVQAMVPHSASGFSQTLQSAPNSFPLRGAAMAPSGPQPPLSGDRSLLHRMGQHDPRRVAPPPPPAAPSPFEPDQKGWTSAPHQTPQGWTPAASQPQSVQQQPQSSQPQRMPNIIRIVTNYVDNPKRPPVVIDQKVERDEDGNDVTQDIHTLLVLLDALRQADNQITQRVTGQRPAPMPAEAETGCPIL